MLTSLSFQTIFAAAPNTQFWDIPINAVDGQFQVFRQLNQVCPESNAKCAKTTHTILQGDDKNGTLTLNSIAPGGQPIFITKEGLVGFKKIGDKTTPEGAIVNPAGFTYVKPISRWQDLGKLVYSGGNFSLVSTYCGWFASQRLTMSSVVQKIQSVRPTRFTLRQSKTSLRLLIVHQLRLEVSWTLCIISTADADAP